MRTRNSPNRMGIWMTRGPRQPTGFTPPSRYRRMVSWETRWRSFPYLSWISRILGCRSVIARICLSCLIVRGRVTSRTITVKTMIATPMLLKQMVYNTTSRFNKGRIIISRQRSSTPKGSYLALRAVRSTCPGTRPEARPHVRKVAVCSFRFSCIPCSRSASTTFAPGRP